MKKGLIISLLALLVLSACEQASELGGTSAGNPPTSTSTRTVVGSVEEEPSADSSSGPAQLRYVAVPGCAADTVLATTLDGNVETATIASDCAFAIELTVGQAYVMSFEKDGDFIGTLLFKAREDSFLNAYLILSEGEEDVDIGKVVFDGYVATPEILPVEQNDQDGDGEDDFADADDNNDGVVDVEDEDCDLDGLIDDLDQDLSDCETDDTVSGGSDSGSDDTDSDADGGSDDSDATDDADDSNDNNGQNELHIVEVFPRHMAGIANVFPDVNLEQPVEVRADCDIDLATVTETSFVVQDELGLAVACTYSLAEGESDVMLCEHEALFAPAMVYEATVDGVLCEGGETIKEKSWQWETVAEGLINSLF